MLFRRALPPGRESSHVARRCSVIPSAYFRTGPVFLALMICISLVSASAQSDHDVRLYHDAITTLERQGDPTDLQRFVSTAPFGRLKDDGLQWLIWHFRTAHDARARQWAQQLLKTQPDNPLALAAVSDAEHQLDS